jgi:predicted ATP-grasp superfamily ATP-dependent carboligase
MDYKKQIESLLAKRGVEDIKKYVKDQANRRNKLLYASNDGYPGNVDIEDKFYPAQKNRVFAMLNTYLLIEPYAVNCQFVQDTLNAYLNIFTKIGLKKSLWECIKNCFFKKK